MGLLLLFLIAIVLLWFFGAVGLVHMIMHPRRKTFAVALGKGDPTDPADLQLDAEEVTFTLTDKTRSPGWVIDGKKPDGPTVVIVHGFGDSRYGSLRRVPIVLDSAKKVVVFDLPGQGESEAKHGYGGLREPYDVLEVLGQLEPDHAERIVLLGVSLGGGIVVAAGAKAQGDLRQRLVGVIAEAPYRLWDEPLHNMFRRRRYPRWPIIPLAGLWLWVAHPEFRHFDRAAYAAQLACPLLVLHGSEDGLCPPDAARCLADAAERGTYVEIDGGAHNDLPFEFEHAYRPAVAGFIESLGQADGSGKM